MPIEVQCAACGKRLKAPDDQAGRKGKCPSCKGEISIPAVAASAATNRGETSTLEVIDPKNWFALGITLQATQTALLVACIACGVVSLGILATRLGLADWLTARTISLLFLWGHAILAIAWGAAIAGWIGCLAAWPGAERKWLRFAIWAGAASIGIILIVVSLREFGIGVAQTDSGMPADSAKTPTAILVISSLAFATTLVLFNFFLAGVQARVKPDQKQLNPIIFAAVLGILAIWCAVANVMFEPKSWLAVLSNVANFSVVFVWTWINCAATSRDLRVSQAYKRL
jgi:phage FluMu protein Com